MTKEQVRGLIEAHMNATGAINSGLIVSDFKLERGYVSRKTTLETAEVKTAQGRRKGQKYICWPHETSTQYHYRVYFK